MKRLTIALALTVASTSAALAQASEVNVGALVVMVGLWLAVVIGFIWLLLLPTIIAFRKGHPHRWLILVINVLFSATGIGWIVALIWALNSLPFTDDFHGRLGTVRVAADEPLPVAPTTSPQSADPADQLQRLKQLHASGVLTDDEYQQARKPLLDRLYAR